MTSACILFTFTAVHCSSSNLWPSTLHLDAAQFIPYRESRRPVCRLFILPKRPGSMPRLEAGVTPTPETKGGTKEGEGAGGAFRQLVGLKGATRVEYCWVCISSRGGMGIHISYPRGQREQVYCAHT